MVFGRKPKKESDASASTQDEAQSAPSSSSQPTQKKRKPAELLASVVNESAVGAAIDVLKRNDAFALPNGSSWVGLLLAADNIGGLNQKQKSDATKGSIIELIAADKIQVVATREMLDEEFFGIVPTPETLGRMSEYRLLTEASYYWAVFQSQDGGQALKADAVASVTATYADAVAISEGTKALRDVLPDVWAWSTGGDDTATTQSVPPVREPVLAGAHAGSPATAPSITDDPLGDVLGDDEGVDYAALAEDDEDIEVPDDLGAFEAEFAASSQGDEDEDALGDSWRDEDTDLGPTELVANVVTQDEGAADYYRYVEENRDRVVDEVEVRDTIARRFLSSDLDLVVDLAEFERTFATNAVAISIDVADDANDWLGSQVAQLSRQANAELALLHQTNTDDLREMFIETMALHVEKTMDVVSTDRPGSQYHSLMVGAKQDFEAYRAAAPQEVAAQRKEITARFEAAARSRAEQAAAHAKAQYEDKNRPKLERDLAEVGIDLDRRHEEQYAHDRQTVLELRRKDANVRMDLGTNRVFELLRERQDVQRERERELLERWNDTLTRFIDDNRKNDVARAQALADSLARDHQVEDLKVEHANRLAEIRREHTEVEGRLQAEMVRIREEAILQIRTREAEWNSTLTTEQERVRSSSAMVDQLSEQIARISTDVEAHYRTRIATLEADKQAFGMELDRTTAVQKRANSIMVVLIITLVVAALAVGAIIGWGWGNASNPSGLAVVGSSLNVSSSWSGS